MTRAAVVTHGTPGQIGSGLARLQAVAQEHGVELLYSDDEATKHGVDSSADASSADLAVVLGGDGTVLRALTRFLGTGVPVIGVNFGRVGFLSSMGRRDLEAGLGRVFAGEYDVVELPTLELEHPDGRTVAVNDVVVSSASLGRMIELELAVGDEELGRQPCDGIICSTPSGSTAYNLSNGGPVLMWGLEAIALTYVAAHSLHARPLVIPPGADVIVWNRSAGRRGRRARRRPPRLDARKGGACGRAHRRRALAPRDASGGDLRAPLSPELCFVGSGSRISSSSARRSSSFAPGLNAVTGETGAGKTIFAQAIGLLLGARADVSSVGSDGTEAYVEAELDVPDGFFDDEELAALAELRPEGRGGARRSRGVSSATGARGRMRGVAPSRGKTWPQLRSGSSPCRGSSSSAGSRVRRSSSTCSTRSAVPSRPSGDARRNSPGES